MLAWPTLVLLNHLLQGESWARDRLLPFAGKTALLQFGSTALLLRISDGGLFETTATGTPATVSITLPGDAPALALTGQASLLTSATIVGSVDLAETLGFVLRNLRWDIEHDLSKVLGDVVAHRSLQLAKQLGQWQLVGLRKLAIGVAEYLTEEDAAIAHRGDIERFCLEVDALRDDFARMERRLARLELG
jgi:ubiquinone biosynthesis protein UbiJ